MGFWRSRREPTLKHALVAIDLARRDSAWEEIDAEEKMQRTVLTPSENALKLPGEYDAKAALYARLLSGPK